MSEMGELYIYIKDDLWDTYESPTTDSWAWKYIFIAKNKLNGKLIGTQSLSCSTFNI